MTSAHRKAGSFTLVVQMPSPLGSELRQRARLEDRTMSSLIRVALRRYLGVGEEADGDEEP